MPELLVVSDSHLSSHSPEAQANWDVVVDAVADAAPDLVVHAGDLTQRGLGDHDLLRFGRKQLDRLPVPWLAIPGNHDVGDFGDGAGEAIINHERREAYDEIIGPRFWVQRIGRWRLIGFDSQDLLMDPARGRAIHDRLRDELAGPEPTVLFQHRPLHVGDDARGRHPRNYVLDPWAEPLEALVALPQVRGHVSGHVHQWRSHVGGDALHVWAPSTWCIVTDRWQPVIGTKTVGAVRLLLDDAGGVTADLVVPEGMVAHVLGETV
ncbi:MAG: metallophosphoesterase [Actinomycetota bacterium]